jgi:hypothetical protein
VTCSRTLERLRARETDSLLSALSPGDYLALLAYVPPGDAAWAATLDRAREALSRWTGAPTTLGYGPRYLHSTGQLHKGGPPTALFLIITAEPRADLPVPGRPFSFGVLEAAQAIGDFESLDREERRAVYVRLPAPDPGALARFIDALAPPAR